MLAREFVAYYSINFRHFLSNVNQIYVKFMHALKENCRVLLDEILKYLIASQAFKMYFATFMDFFFKKIYIIILWHFKISFCMRKAQINMQFLDDPVKILHITR